MSADNLVGVRQLTSGQWGVLHFQYHEVTWAEHQKDPEAALDSLFTKENGAEFFNLENEAFRRAEEIAEGLYVCEYGVQDFPRPRPLPGPVGNYKVVVARSFLFEYHFSDMTPEEAQEHALEMTRKPPLPWGSVGETEVEVRVVESL